MSDEPIPYRFDPVNPKDSLRALLSQVDDHWDDPVIAWIYGVIIGWDDSDSSPMEMIAKYQGWTDDQVTLLRCLHAGWEALS